MSFIKVRPVADQPFRASVWRDPKPGALTASAVYLGRLTLHAERHYVCLSGDDIDTYWYTQLTKALRHLATREAGDEAHRLAIASGHAVVGAAGYIGGRTTDSDTVRAAIIDNAHTKHAVTTNIYSD